MTVSDPASLHRDLAAAHAKLEEQNTLISGLTALLKRYENENMSTSTNSGFNDRKRAFRKAEKL